MKTIIHNLLMQSVSSLQSRGELPDNVTAELQIKIDRTKDEAHGDFATNLAMMLAKPCKQSPRALADLLIAAIPAHPQVTRVEIAGPGFINFFMADSALSPIVAEILAKKDQFGCSELGTSKKVLIEFVSANPTGPLHVGHGRGAAFGATLSNLLECAGFDVTREYYVNDAGRQMAILAASVWLRYLTIAGQPVIFPVNGYKGDYVNDIANEFYKQQELHYVRDWNEVVEGLPLDEDKGGDKELYIDAMITRAKQLIGMDGFNQVFNLALNSVLNDIKDDLTGFGVQFDNWFSEASLVQSGAIDKSIHALDEKQRTYIEKEALWFKAQEFGDEKDRVLIRANGQSTYFASDVAYHWNKYDRGFDQVIDIFGADHHGYVTRVKAAVNALGHDENALAIILVQFAILYRGETRVQMSTRSGSFVTLRELRQEVGNDAARFFYVMRKPEQHMDFDLDLAKSQSNDNPVYYIQYAHARISSVFRQLQSRGLSWDEQAGLHAINQLDAPHELSLLSLLAYYPEMINKAAAQHEPHHIAYYLRELANGLHSYYNAIQLICEDESLRAARMCLLQATRQVIKNGLEILGVSAPESM